MSCIVTIPAHALTARGLSKPWIVTGCDQTVTPTFAECAVLNPAEGIIKIYSPLLINAGSLNFIAPVVPVFPARAIVGCWFGTNGGTTTLAGFTTQAKCTSPVTALGQFAACNALAFFAAARCDNVVIPPLGIGLNGKPCYTTRSFEIVDMDQSDNVVTSFLMDPTTKKLAQKNLKNAIALPNATEVNNGSDNLLLDAFYRPALRCSAFTAPNLADPTGPQVGALALNEIQANAMQAAPVALVPPLDPMVVDANMNPDFEKQSIYRANVDQPAPNLALTAEQSLQYCQNFLNVTAPGFITDMKFLIGRASPAPANGKDLFTFLAQRFAASWVGLTCNILTPIIDVNGNSVISPLTANFDGNGVCISATFNTPKLIQLLLENGGPNSEALALGLVLPVSSTQFLPSSTQTQIYKTVPASTPTCEYAKNTFATPASFGYKRVK
ncbi:hypothetical protein HK100_000172 [Physocladia obscura]|uniref:Uncharacterized protein n=1 Tax=Physocladia obscura TaxID=109957 RepID=A0AAD5T0K3_9FUNG|nr:hypothetical protein HK100_000172 [Physocladia obscura]